MSKYKKPSKRIGIPKEEEIELAEVGARAEAIDKKIISLDDTQRKAMASWLWHRVDDAITSKIWQETKNRIQRMRANYEEGVPRTTVDFKGAHDYRTFIAASQADGMRSRLIGVFTVDPIVKIEGRNEEGVKNARNAERFLDYHHDTNVGLPEKGDLISTYLTVEGHAVMYYPWRLVIEQNRPKMITKQVYVDGDKEKLVNVASQIELSEAQAAGCVPKIPEEYEVIETKGPEVMKNWPDLKILSLLDYLNPKSSRADTPPAWQAVREWFTLDDLMKLSKRGKIYSGALNEMKKWLRQLPKDAETETAGMTGATSTNDQLDPPLEKDALDSVVQCWVIWGKQKVPGMSGLQDVVTLYHHESMCVLQTRVIPFVQPEPPITHLRMIQIPWRFAGVGVMELSTPGEQAINDLANFVLDEGKIFSCLPYIYNKTKLPGGVGSPFDFWKGVGVRDVNKDFKELQFRDRRPMDINVSTFVRGNSERRVGIGDLQLGRESDVTGKQPPTARGIISILREGQVRFNLLNFSMIGQLIKFAEKEMSMFQQFLGRKVAAEILGEDGKSLFPDGMSRHQMMGSFKFSANTDAQNMVRELDAELNMLLYDKLRDNPFIASSQEAYYEMTRDLLLSAGKKKLWIKPLSVYRKATGRDKGMPEGLTPEEQQFVEELINAGVPMSEVKRRLQEFKSGQFKEEGDDDMTDEQTQALLVGDEAEEGGGEDNG